MSQTEPILIEFIEGVLIHPQVMHTDAEVRFAENFFKRQTFRVDFLWILKIDPMNPNIKTTVHNSLNNRHHSRLTVIQSLSFGHGKKESRRNFIRFIKIHQLIDMVPLGFEQIIDPLTILIGRNNLVHPLQHRPCE